MISLLKSGSTVTFTFDENSGYLQNGTIDVPVNSLSLITDESDMATFRKSASNDIFISARYEEFGMTKSELESWYKEYMVGDVGGGVDSGTVQTMIDESISGKADTTAVTESIAEATSGKVNTTTYTAYTSSTQTTLNSKLNKSAVENSLNNWSTNPVQNKVLFNELRISGLTMDEENVDILENNANDWTYEEDAGGEDYHSHECPSYLRKVEFTISADTECYGYVGVQDRDYYAQVHVNFTYHPAITDPDDPSYPQDAYIDDTDLNVEVYNDDFEPLSSSTFSVSGATITLEIPNFIVYDEWEGVYKYYNWAEADGDALRYKLYNYNDEYISGAVTASASGAVVTYTPVKDAVEDVEESLSGKADSSAVTQEISAAVSGKVNTSSVVTAVTSASTDSEIPTAKAVYDAIPSATTYSAGRGISIANDTISFSLPIYLQNLSNLKYGSSGNTITDSAYSLYNNVFGTDNSVIAYSNNKNCKYNTAIGLENKLYCGYGHTVSCNFICGQHNTLSSTTENMNWSVAFGQYNTGNKYSQTLFGSYNNATNTYETAFGKYNNSVSASTTFGDSGNTLFSVGNGTSSARHNAFEIRQNGDIYLTKDGQDVKLQDQLGGGVTPQEFSAYTAATDSRLTEDEEVTAAGINAVNDKFGGLSLVKLTQAQYDALTVKDNNVLYIIIN